jgi:cytochrome c553
LLAMTSLLAGLVSACDAPPRADPFRRSGEVIAFGGGDGGASAACFTCHGLKGEGDGRLTPRLAGLDTGYLQRQLDDYANGRRDHAPMRQVVRRLSPEDRSKVSAYYAALAIPAAIQPKSSGGAELYRKGDPARGLVACAQCHGADGEGGGAGNPALGRQPAAYLEAQLTAWRTGRRYNDPLGEMRLISRRLSTEEVRAVAGYAAALPGVRHSPARAACPAEHHACPRSDASAPRRHASGSSRPTAG